MGRQSFENKSSIRKSSSKNDHGGDEQFMIQNSDASRIVVLHGDVTEFSISGAIVQLLHLANQNHRPIHLVISTYGGSVDEMFSLYDTIKFLPCAVHTIALGKVMSAGVLLLASGVKGKRMVGQSARIMIHPVSGESSGNVFEMINESKEAKRLHDLMVSTLVRETNMTPDQIEKIMKSGHDYYVTPKEAIQMGIVDKIVGDNK